MRKAKYNCKVCNQPIRIKYHKDDFNYYYCEHCNLIFLIKNGEFIKSYEPRKQFIYKEESV